MAALSLYCKRGAGRPVISFSKTAARTKPAWARFTGFSVIRLCY